MTKRNSLNVNNISKVINVEDYQEKDACLVQVGAYSVYPENMASLDSWLDDLIIDAYMFVLCKDVVNSTHLESHLVRQWRSGKYIMNPQTRRALFSKRWLLGGANVNNNHWLLLVADTVESVYYELNSLPSSRCNVIEHFRIFLETNTSTKWKRLFKACGIQQDGISCGIFTLMHAEATTKGSDPATVQQSQVVVFRKKIAKKIASFEQNSIYINY